MTRNQSERIRNEAVRLMREREDKTTMTQRDADRRIGERLHDEVPPSDRLLVYSCLSLPRLSGGPSCSPSWRGTSTRPTSWRP